MTNRRRPRLILLFIALGISVLYAIAGIVTAQETPASTLLQVFTTRFLGIFIEAAPFLLLGSVVSGLIESFVSANDLARWMPRRILPATIAGGLLGFVFPVCECGVVPVVRRLYNKGMPMGVGVAFLLAAPVMNPIVLVSTYIAFGSGVVFAGRFIVTLLVAVTIGLVFSYGAKPLDVLKPVTLAPIRGGAGMIAPLSTPKRLLQALNIATDEFFDMGFYLVIGSMLAAGMQTLVSQDVLIALGEGPIISVLAMQAIAFVLSVCSTVDAFLALAFASTFTTGSILAFLTFGPMVDIKSMLMFMGVFRARVVFYLVMLPLLLTLWISVWINLNMLV